MSGRIFRKDIVNKIIIKNQRFSEIIMLQLLLLNWIHFRFIRMGVYTSYHSSPGVAGWLPKFFMDTRLPKFQMRLRKTFSYAYIRHLNAELSFPVIPFSSSSLTSFSTSTQYIVTMLQSFFLLTCPWRVITLVSCRLLFWTASGWTLSFLLKSRD